MTKAGAPQTLTEPTKTLSVAVVICAYLEERLSEIVAAVESAFSQTHPATDVIVVVDHNPALFERVRSLFPQATVLENAGAQGLSGARTTGIGAARTDIVAFLDDDAVAEPTWLEAFVDVYSSPDVIAVGGLTLPLWECDRPAWLPREFDWVLGCAFLGMPTERSEVRNIFGGNGSYRRAVFDDVGGFNDELGRTASTLLSCEETEMCIRIRQRHPESRLMFDDKAVIHHRVKAPRVRFSYFRARCYAEGLSKARVSRLAGADKGLSTERQYSLRTLPRGVLRGLRDGFKGDLGGFGRAAAIVMGWSITATGFAVGLMGARRDR